MELFDRKEFEKYIETNYPIIHEGIGESHVESDRVGSRCDSCNRDVFLKMNSYYQEPRYGITATMPRFQTIYTECPNCGRRNFIQTVVLSDIVNASGDEERYYKHYQLFRLPDGEVRFETSNIPVDYPMLIKTVNEALYCMNHTKHTSAAIMFRRALQLVAKDVLGAKGRYLSIQLEWLKVNENLLKIDVSEIFHDNSQLIKDVGNQAAHPGEDITLQEFSKDDVDKLHDLFLIIINEIFIKPKKIKELQDELKSRRKLK